MKLVFNRSEDGRTSLSHWNGITIILRDSEAFGELDVMFTGVSQSGRALFARLIPDYAKKVNSSGFSYTGNSLISATGKTEDDEYIFFTPGLVNNYVYVSNIVLGSIGYPPINSMFYVSQLSDLSHKCIGVEDPSMIRGFTEQFNPKLIEFINTIKLSVGEMLFSEYWGRQVTVEVTKVLGWNHGIGINVRTGEQEAVNLHEYRRYDDNIRSQQSSYVALFCMRQSTDAQVAFAR